MSSLFSTAVKRNVLTQAQAKARQESIETRRERPAQNVLADALYLEARKRNITIESHDSFNASVEFAASGYKQSIKELNKNPEQWKELVKNISDVLFNKDNLELKELPTRGEGWGEFKGNHYVSVQPVLKPQLPDTLTKALKSFVDNKEVKIAAAVAAKTDDGISR